MYKHKKVLAIITARGGSKGLPGKNIKNLLGKPLIAWSIDQAKASKYIDKLIVSTDDVKIAEVAKSYGADIPFIRPAALASDQASSIDVIEHAINFLKNQGSQYDILILLEPTSPLREVEDIDLSIAQLVDTPNAESIAGVSKVEGQHPDFLVSLSDNFMRSYQQYEVKRRQDLSSLFFFEGTIYASYISAFLEKRSFYHDRTLGYIVPKWKSFEIDDLIDFMIVEKILEERLNKRI